MSVYLILYFLVQFISLLALGSHFGQLRAEWAIQGILCVILFAITKMVDVSNFLLQPGYFSKDKCQMSYSEELGNKINIKICKFCSNQLKMRQKHCKKCDKCVSTFDHHCTFMDVCIGQFNRPYFYLFLVAQMIQLSSVLFALIMDELFQQSTTSGMTLISAFLVPLFLDVTLLVYHTWLMIFNLTTWQVLTPHKIQYINVKKLDENQKLEVDVFNQGVFKNLGIYWSVLCREKVRIDWQKYYNPK